MSRGSQGQGEFSAFENGVYGPSRRHAVTDAVQFTDPATMKAAFPVRNDEPVNSFVSAKPTAAKEQVDNPALLWDYPTMIVTLDAKRRVSIPAKLAPSSPGDQFEASFDPEDDVVTLRRLKRKSNWLEVWKQCPVAMDDLPERRRDLPKKLKL